MAQWENQIDLATEWETGEVSLIANKIICCLKTIPAINPDVDKKKEQLIVDFGFRILDEDEHEFNIVMERLYNWADTALDSHFNGKKVCWVKTF